MKYIIYSFRKYGEPKLPKPKGLKGIKQSYSIDYIYKKCTCQIFIAGDDVWIKHRDYFSPPFIPNNIKDLGIPLNYRLKKYFGESRSNKFLYPDSWGDIILRQEAWIKIEELIKDIKSNIFILKIRDKIRELQEECHGFKNFELCCTDMERLWEKLVIQLRSDYVK